MSDITLIRRSLLVLVAVCLWAVPAISQNVWIAQGPAPSFDGQVEGITNRDVVGAVHAVAPHPNNANTMFIGSVNGGVWRTDNALASSPNWVPQTDLAGSLSIGDIAFDPTDNTNQTLGAGIGRFSNFGGDGGALTGILRTVDGGANWTPLGQVALAGTNISGVAPRGNIIVVADSIGGIWRSIDTGINWTRISGLAGSGLPAGAAFDLAGIPGVPGTLLTNAGSNGIYQSTDTGATWVRISNATMNALAYSNVRISALNANTIFVAIASGGTLGGVFRTGNGGTNWATLGVPGNLHPGGQAGTNLSMVADPNNGTVFYVGGDRQPGPADGIPWPNGIGANDYTGRLFRGTATAGAATVYQHLTHSNSQGAVGGGTQNGSAPHADSRNMAFDANGNLIEVDDGGVYRRTQPQSNAGVWQSMNGNLQNTEFHSVAWDAVSNQVIGGAQDVGTPEQREVAQRVWRNVDTADGGVVAIDDISTPGQSNRFSSRQNMRGFVMRSFDVDNNLVAQLNPTLTVIGGGNALNAQFYTPVVVNNVTGARLVIGAQNSVYESTDSGATITEIGVGIQTNASAIGESMAYGASDNSDILYVGSGAQVFVRTGAPPGSVLAASAAYPGTANVVDVAVDPTNSQSAVAIDASNVFQTPDAGGTWNNITGNLIADFGPGQLRSVDLYSAAEQRAVIVGADRGVYQADLRLPNRWSPVCSGLPNAPVTDLEYDEADGVLLAGTMGRGAWTCAPGQPRPMAHHVKFVCGKGDTRVLAEGLYTTAINILNKDAEGAAPVTYRRSFSIGQPGETFGGASALADGAALAPGEAVEIDCDDILSEVRGLCPDGLCKGFATIDSRAPLEIVTVYSAHAPASDAVTDLTLDRVTEDDRSCTEATLTIPAFQRLFVPPHVQGDREFDGHGPCVRFSLDLRKVDNDTALAATTTMHAYECSGSFTAPQHDFTAAFGSRTEIIASAGPNGRILGHSASGLVTREYIDNDHADDTFTHAAPAAVSELRFVGDTSGSEAGTKTSVVVSFRAIDVKMQTCSVPSDSG